jgi:hypothetical protein
MLQNKAGVFNVIVYQCLPPYRVLNLGGEGRLFQHLCNYEKYEHNSKLKLLWYRKMTYFDKQRLKVSKDEGAKIGLLLDKLQISLI